MKFASFLFSSTLLMGSISILPGYAQLTVVNFGGSDLDTVNGFQQASQVGAVSISQGVSPIGTASDGSETTFQYDQSFVISTRVNNQDLVATVTGEGTIIASASGYKMSVVDPLPTEVGVAGAQIGLDQECDFIDQNTGRCSVALNIEVGGQSTGSALVTTGTAHPTVYPALSVDNDNKDNSASSLPSVSTIGMIITVALGTWVL
ncbi:hypothetical protein K435DRAFT_853886 [Dendrothele bispora CBS 962.96]|uniref:Uncharacterized protein n=1 Tax=Dendrothele bispora (strain CBS 962.96) TaxID=1314807 RepID=A0A4S8MGJ5_DENBC|nr:hypothetical protein K435DRAFT_853886 [Dendrothele bispora CBS 962.96]